MRGSEYGRSRQVHVVSATHPNKPMHPTANTRDVIKLELAGRRVIGGVRPLGSGDESLKFGPSPARGEGCG